MNRGRRGFGSSLERFLVIARCPECEARLDATDVGLACARGHTFPVNELGIPLFALPKEPLSTAERRVRLEDAAAYAALHAFAGSAQERADAEGLYRTASDLLLRGLRGRRVSYLLDLGCGSGRTLADAASAFPDALTIGLDLNEQALTVAYAAACLRGRSVEADLRRWGFGYRSFAGRRLANVFLVQAEAERPPFAASQDGSGFDAVTCINVLDRAGDPLALLRGAARIMRPAGRLVLASPLNWRQTAADHWSSLASLGGLAALVTEAGFQIETAFDGLIYREVIDARGSATDWQVACIAARRA